MIVCIEVGLLLYDGVITELLVMTEQKEGREVMSGIRNPIKAPPTVADLIGIVEDSVDLPVRRRADIASDFRCLSAMLGAQPSALHADCADLRRHLGAASPSGFRLSPTRWRNMTSSLNKALALAGIAVINGRPVRQKLSPPWSALRQRLHDRYDRFALTRFMGFCTARNIEPNGVSDELMRAFGEALTAAHVARPKQIVRDTVKTWNKAAATLSSWPAVRLSTTNNRADYALPLSAYPPSFGADVEAYLAHIAGRDLVESDIAQPAARATLKTRRQQILQLAAALVASARDASSITFLADLVDVEAAKIALNWLYVRNGRRKTGQLHNFALLLVILARHWVKAPEADVTALKALRRKLDPGKTGMTKKNRRRLLQFTDPRNVAKLLSLPSALVAQARRSERAGIADALKVQTALAIAIELTCPLRAKNLAGLDIERHIVRSRPGCDGVVHLVIAEGEVKNKAALEFELPADVVQILDLYLAQFRPRLIKAPSPFLFPAQDGGHKAPSGFGTQIDKVIFHETGLKMNAHLFRHLAAFLYLKARPGEYETVRLLLAHKSAATTVAFYCGLEQPAAFDRYDQVLDAYRRQSGASDAQQR